MHVRLDVTLGRWAYSALLSAGTLFASTPLLAAEEPEGTTEAASASSSTEAGPSGASAVSTGVGGPSQGTHLIFVEAGFRQDLGSFSRRDVVGDNEQSSRDDVDTFGYMLHVGFLERVASHVRLGGAFAYGGNYNYEGNNLLGQLMTLDFRVEFGIPLSDKWGLIGTPRFGLSMLIPGGQLADRIQENQAAGYDTWSGPRYGFIGGADIGARYGLTNWLSARATVGYAWSIMLLLNTHASDGEISASQSWTVQASRLSGNLGLEVNF